MNDRVAARLRGFGPVGILAMLLIFAGNLLFIPLSALLVLVWVRASRTPWRDIGYSRPKSWVQTTVLGITLGVAFKFLMKAVVMPLLGADPINRAYHFLAGNPAALPGTLYAVTVGAGFGEETLFRGYLFERLGKLLGSGVTAKAVIVLVTSALFAAAHYRVQGVPGVQQAAVTGLAFAIIYAASGRLALLMIAHAAFDVTAVAMIYWNLETRVAHLIFS